MKDVFIVAIIALAALCVMEMVYEDDVAHLCAQSTHAVCVVGPAEAID